MRRTALILLMCIFVLSCAAASQATTIGWTLVYSNDASGNATYGTLDDLKNAIKAGKQIRFELNGTDTYDAPWVGIYNGYVYAQSPQLVGSSINTQGTLQFNAPYYFAFYNASSSGAVILSRWNIGEHVPVGDTALNFPIKWFVNQ